jgi:hypothetical protein
MTNPFYKRKKNSKPQPKKSSPPSARDAFLKDAAKYQGLTTNTASAGSTLTAKSLQDAIRVLGLEDRRQQALYSQYQQQRAVQMQGISPQGLAQQLANINNLNKRGAGQSSMAYSPHAFSPLGGGPPQKSMNPPKFLQGYKVTVRSGRTVWTVQFFEERQDPYAGRNIRYYFLRNEKGQETREQEEDLVVYDQNAPSPIKKAQVDFDSVVISDEKREQILEALEQVNQMDLIFEKWGFGETIEKGRGISMLFYGPPGTGKTLMAQAIANKLGKALKVIANADIESSVPGEAERNIRKHFEGAKDGKVDPII